MNCSKLRECLIKISIIEKLGTIRRSMMKNTTRQVVEIEKIRKIYEYGNAKEKTGEYFVVYSNQSQGGLFVYLIDCMTQIAYALDKGYIPVVDMINFPNNLKNMNQKKINAWELYFKQPMGISVQEIYGAKNIHFHNETKEKMLYIGDVEAGTDYQDYKVIIDESKPYDVWLTNQEYMHRFKQFWKEYMRYSDATQQYIEMKYQELFAGRRKILGLLCRGTDYISLKPRGHYVQPSNDMIVEKVQKVIDEMGCDCIFLATEDQVIYEYIKRVFGNKVIALDTERVKYKNGYLLKDLYQKQKMDIYKRQLNYLTEMELLARCQCLVAGKTTGSRFLPVMKEDAYEYLFYWELGRYE